LGIIVIFLNKSEEGNKEWIICLITNRLKMKWKQQYNAKILRLGAIKNAFPISFAFINEQQAKERRSNQ